MVEDIKLTVGPAGVRCNITYYKSIADDLRERLEEAITQQLYWEARLEALGEVQEHDD